MDYSFSKRDASKRATLTINGVKVGRVHFCTDYAWMKPWTHAKFRSDEVLNELGLIIERDPTILEDLVHTVRKK